MRRLTYYWINVFTTEQDKGNTLPVFILKKTLSKESMQKIATMMNQSETIFIENACGETPKLHIFTPMHELPFAGHPIIGALQIIQQLNPVFTIKQVETVAGIVNINIDQQKQTYWIQAPIQPIQRESSLDITTTARMLNLAENQIKSKPVWINTGSEQLLAELKDATAIDSVKLDLDLFAQHATLRPGRTIIYLWSRDENNIYARFLYLNNGALCEDSGTGSACSNLGGVQVLCGNSGFTWNIRQGCLLGSECQLFLNVTPNQEIWIGGQNRFMGTGELFWSDEEQSSH